MSKVRSVAKYRFSSDGSLAGKVENRVAAHFNIISGSRVR